MLRVSAFIMALVFGSPGFCQDAPPQLVLKRVVALEYPWFARMARFQGKVELTAVVSREGTVTDVRVISGAPILAEPTKANLAAWQFAGCSSDTCEAKLIFSFVLSGSCDVRTHCPTGFQVDFPGKVVVTAKAISTPMY